MSTLKQGLLKKTSLTNDDLREIEQLAEICNRADHVHMRLGWLKQRTSEEDGPCDFLYYEHGMLVGYLLVDRYGRMARELTGMVHPEHRRKGVFTELLTAARAAWQARGVQKFLLICEEASRSGQAFVAQQGAEHESSESRMVLKTFRESNFFDDRLVFRPATPGDIRSVVMILAEDAHEEFEAITPYVVDFFREPHCQVYITMLGEGGVSCREPIGCLRVYELEDELGIYGFVIRPEYRGRGYGRQTLEETIRALREVSTKPITLEVDTRNTPALNLYRSCGFEAEATYGYYALK